MAHEAKLLIALDEDVAKGFATAKDVRLIENVPEKFEALGKALGLATERLWKGLEESGGRPADEVEIELSVTLEGEGNWVIVTTKVGATARVKLTWSKKNV
jgi:hypothetical protein